MPLSYEKGNYDRISTSFTRPNDGNIYAVSDAVSNSTSAPVALTFASVVRSAGNSGRILTARHIKSSTTTASASFRLWLYRTAPTPVNDNAQFPLLWANRTNRFGFIDFNHTTAGTGSDSSSSMVSFVGLDFITDSSLVDIYGLVMANQAYTPSALEQHFFELGIEVN